MGEIGRFPDSGPWPSNANDKRHSSHAPETDAPHVLAGIVSTKREEGVLDPSKENIAANENKADREEFRRKFVAMRLMLARYQRQSNIQPRGDEIREKQEEIKQYSDDEVMWEVIDADQAKIGNAMVRYHALVYEVRARSLFSEA